MSAIRDYLEETLAREGDSGWLRREPRTTHPEILEAVREYEQVSNRGNDGAERFVEERAGDLPEHRYHGDDDRHPLTKQLGHEVYIAKGLLADERALRAEQEAMLAGGFRLVDDESQLAEGKYTIRCGTLYVGHEQRVWGREHQVRLERVGDEVLWRPKGSRTAHALISLPILLREGWA